MPTVYAAMLELQDRKDFQGLGATSYDAFDDAVSRADALFQEHATEADAIKLFLAPEYTFSEHSVHSTKGSVSVKGLSRSDKHDIYGKICATSAKYPDIFIIAGSIHYSTKFAKGYLSSKKHLSVCPVAWGGQIILKAYKKNYDGFTPGLTPDRWATKNKGETFQVNGLTFGVEICLDHQMKVLLTTVGGRHVDVHILISEGMAPLAMGTAAVDGGLVINCDMSGQATGNGVRTARSNTAGQGIVDARRRGQFEAAERQPLSNGASVALYSGTV